jgi:hypothetical protein
MDPDVSLKNQNLIYVDRWSNPETQAIYERLWPDQPELKLQHANGEQCGSCSFFAAFNSDWGLCCHADSRHHLETVFEHFTCKSHVREGWGPHSFTKDTDFHCRCGGESSEYWDKTISILRRHETPKPGRADNDGQTGHGGADEPCREL